MHALILLCINQYTKFEVPDFTNYNDVIEAKFKENGSRDSNHAPLRVIFHRRLGFDTVYLHALFDELSSLRRYEDMIGAHQNLNGSRDLSTPFLGISCHLWASTCYAQPVYQI